MTVERPVYGRVCAGCGGVFTTGRVTERTCSAACAQGLESEREALRRGTLAPEVADEHEASKAAAEHARTQAIELTTPCSLTPAPRQRSATAKRRGPRHRYG